MHVVISLAQFPIAIWHPVDGTDVIFIFVKRCSFSSNKVNLPPKIYTSLEIGGQTVHKQKSKDCNYEKKIDYRECRNTAVHTNELNDVHCRWADSAGCKFAQRLKQDRQKLTDAVARVTYITKICLFRLSAAMAGYCQGSCKDRHICFLTKEWWKA